MLDNLNKYEVWILIAFAIPLFLILLGIISEIGVLIRRWMKKPVDEGIHFENLAYGLMGTIGIMTIYFIFSYVIIFFFEKA
jgi:hypothetical protein